MEMKIKMTLKDHHLHTYYSGLKKSENKKNKCKATKTNKIHPYYVLVRMCSNLNTHSFLKRMKNDITMLETVG